MGIKNLRNAIYLLFIVIILVGGLSYYRFLQSNDVPSVETKIWKVALLSGGKTFGAQNLEGIKKRMAELGYKEGTNLAYISKDAGSDESLLKQYAEEVSKGGFDVVVSFSSTVTASLLKIPDFKTPTFLAESNPSGIVKNYNVPEGFITGVASSAILTAPKRLQLLKDIVPTIKKVGMIMEKGQKSGGQTRDLLVQEAPKIGIEMFIIEIEKGSANEQKAIASLTKNKIDGYIACTCLDDIWPQLLVQLNKEKIPSINHVSAIGAVKGFLATYSTDHVKVGERVAEKIVEFFKGKTISQIPVEAAGKDFVLELNLKTAKIIGVTVPDVIRSTASKVYEE